MEKHNHTTEEELDAAVKDPNPRYFTFEWMMMNEWWMTMSYCSMTSKVNKNCDTKTLKEDTLPSMAAYWDIILRINPFQCQCIGTRTAVKWNLGQFGNDCFLHVYTQYISIPLKLQSVLFCHFYAIVPLFWHVFTVASFTPLSVH